MIVTKVGANKLTKPAGLNKDDSSSRRVAEDVSQQMEMNGAGGMTQIETGPGDTLESVAKGHLQGTGQKVDIGSLLFEQHKILNENYDQIASNVKDGSNPKDFRTFKGRELPQGLKINLSTTHTQHSATPINPEERDETMPSKADNDSLRDSEQLDSTLDSVGTQNTADGNNFYAGAGSMSNTNYALEMFNVGLSNDTKMGMANYLKPKWS